MKTKDEIICEVYGFENIEALTKYYGSMLNLPLTYKLMQYYADQCVQEVVRQRNEEIKEWVKTQFKSKPYEMSISRQAEWKILNDLDDFLTTLTLPKEPTPANSAQKSSNYKFKVGEKAELTENPLDEQLGESILLGTKTIIAIKNVENVPYTSGQWIKIAEHHDWIDSTYFKPVVQSSSLLEEVKRLRDGYQKYIDVIENRHPDKWKLMTEDEQIKSRVTLSNYQTTVSQLNQIINKADK